MLSYFSLYNINYKALCAIVTNWFYLDRREQPGRAHSWSRLSHGRMRFISRGPVSVCRL